MSAPPESEPAQWVEPTSAARPGDDAGTLSPEQVESWRERGFALVNNALPHSLLERARADALELFPEPGSMRSEKIRDFGSGGRLQFPATSDAVNEITLHPRLLGAVAQLLDVPVRGLRLTQSDLWAKYGRGESESRDEHEGGEFDNQDQRIHVDYPNHTLLHPPVWQQPEAVEIILYLSEVAECGGATALVPRTGDGDPAYRYPIVDTPGVGSLTWLNDRQSAEAYLEREAPESARFRAEHLYPREVRARYGFGSLLLYRHDTWHRGTPLLPGAMRLAHNLTFRKAASEWISVLHPGWAWAMYRSGRPMERLIATASSDQRCVLGFPAPGDRYWTHETLAAVEARYGPLGFDASPYLEALQETPSR